MAGLLDDYGTAALVLFSHLLSAEGFELLDSQPGGAGMPPFGLLDTVPEPALRKAQWWERHLIEVETGLLPDAAEGTLPRPEYDPKWRTLSERVSAKAAELAASGNPVSERTVQRLRGNWRDQGVWGLVDRRGTGLSRPTREGDEGGVEGGTPERGAARSSSPGAPPRGGRAAARPG